MPLCEQSEDDDQCNDDENGNKHKKRVNVGDGYDEFVIAVV
jgi:hypothetical protein